MDSHERRPTTPDPDHSQTHIYTRLITIPRPNIVQQTYPPVKNSEGNTIFDQNGVDIYFLNRPPLLEVKDPTEIDEVLKDPPEGYSNLARALEYIFGLNFAQRTSEKKMLVFVATDAEATNANDMNDLTTLENVMWSKRDAETTHVMFLLCNDSEASVKLLSKWDREMDHVDLLDDFLTEKDKVLKQHGQEYPFNYGEYIMKALLGAIDEEFDSLGEYDEQQ
ncbi:unnamed protein product [Rotaria sordida]|uniref:VWFA domain-containing protein n=1 Tax=Rotaria sordida TaxID=392033 RepID=A0A819P692_9BILA|nr:unnamed protein product [Rotaria sordida]